MCVHGSILKRWWYKRSTQGDNIELLIQGSQTIFSILKTAKRTSTINCFNNNILIESKLSQCFRNNYIFDDLPELCNV